MDEEKKVLKGPAEAYAPFNFVPFPEQVLLREGALPGHDRFDPDLHTGEVRITMTAQTPVFISDGHQDPRSGPHFFRTPDGRTAIPGSSLRGMTRENMQILSRGSSGCRRTWAGGASSSASSRPTRTRWMTGSSRTTWRRWVPPDPSM